MLTLRIQFKFHVDLIISGASASNFHEQKTTKIAKIGGRAIKIFNQNSSSETNANYYQFFLFISSYCWRNIPVKPTK